MKKIIVEVDTRILATIDEVAQTLRTTRSDIVRRALYATVYAAKRQGVMPAPAPSCGPMIENANLRVVGGKLVDVDAFGIPL